MSLVAPLNNPSIEIQEMNERVFNFSAGPAVLPLPVLEMAQAELLSFSSAGASVLEISHRSSHFQEILQTAKQQLARLLGIDDQYRILFMQGGSRLQFSMVPMNLLQGSSRSAGYVLTGSWGRKARDEAEREGKVHVLWDGQSTRYDRLPRDDQLEFNDDSAYVHITSNETIEGVQFGSEPDTGEIPLVCDASSDFLSRPLTINKYGLLYACAQKNAGPAGVTLVVIREDILQENQSSFSLPGYLNYREHINNDSLYNTPPTFGIYLVGLIANWILEEIGGLEKMAALNQEKAQLLYDVIDQSEGFFHGHATCESRSSMNVTFRLADSEVEKRFLEQAEGNGLCSLKGHRSVGGIRASIYNAMPREGVVSLRDFMWDFAQQNG